MINNKHIKSLAAAFVLVLSSLSMNAQYKGVVLDAADNSPLPGAVITSGQNSAMTDMDGRWSLDAQKGAEAQISFVGYVSKTILLGDEKNISIKLSYDQAGSTLDEVVVVGYGVQKKSNVTGAISSVKSEDLEDLQLPRIETALQGRTSGVTVVQSSGQPGSG